MDFQREQELKEQYREMLDECCEEYKIGNLTFQPSDILESCDPVAFRIGFHEYIDSLEKEEASE